MAEAILAEANEIFKDIPGYHGRYQVSNKGRIWSVIKHRFLKPYINQWGYHQVALYFGDGRRKKEMVHRLVAITFLPNPQSLPQVNHKDEDKSNNCVENLEWCTQQYNNQYGTRGQRASLTNKTNGKRKIPVLQCDLQGNVIKEWPSAKDAELANNYSTGHITQVCKGQRKTAFGFLWKYKTQEVFNNG